MKTRTLCCAIAAACFAVPAKAQETPVPPEGEIVVEGERLEEAAIVRSLVQRFADTHGPGEPAARFFDALCVSVGGLNRAGNEWIRARIEDNARSVGLAVLGDDCRTNAVVLIHDDTGALVQQIAEDRPNLLPRENRLSVERQVEAGAPVVIWHNEEDRNSGGRRLISSQIIPGMPPTGRASGLGVTTRVNVDNWPSRSEPAHSRGLQSAAIIFDGGIVEGMLIERVADYATLRLLAPDLTPLAGEVPEPASITAPFPAESGPPMLTRFDRAYLSALYSMRPNAPAIQLAGAVAREYEGEE